MEDLISRADLFKELSVIQYRPVSTAMKIIKEMPTKTYPTGEWVEEYDESAGIFFRRRWRCTNCNDWQTYGTSDYCPNCGAKMKGSK